MKICLNRWVIGSDLKKTLGPGRTGGVGTLTVIGKDEQAHSHNEKGLGEKVLAVESTIVPIQFGPPRTTAMERMVGVWRGGGGGRAYVLWGWEWGRKMTESQNSKFPIATLVRSLCVRKLSTRKKCGDVIVMSHWHVIWLRNGITLAPSNNNLSSASTPSIARRPQI